MIYWKGGRRGGVQKRLANQPDRTESNTQKTSVEDSLAQLLGK